MIKKALTAGLTSLLFAAMVACDNTPGPGTAEVKVIDNAGLTQAGIDVKLYCTEPECVVIREGKTNELGVYTETFELPVVLRVRAVRYDTTRTKVGLPPNEITRVSVDSLCGEGFIQVEHDKIATETITILQCR